MSIKDAVALLFGVISVGFVGFLLYYNYDILEINDGLKQENYELRKQVNDLKGYRYEASNWEDKYNRLAESCGVK